MSNTMGRGIARALLLGLIPAVEGMNPCNGTHEWIGQ